MLYVGGERHQKEWGRVLVFDWKGALRACGIVSKSGLKNFLLSAAREQKNPADIPRT